MVALAAGRRRSACFATRRWWSTDLDSIVGVAHRFIKAGSRPGSWWARTARPTATSPTRSRLGRSCASKSWSPTRRLAEVLVAEHQDALIFIATAVYEKRRLSDERLDEAVRVAAGFTLPRPTA